MIENKTKGQACYKFLFGDGEGSVFVVKNDKSKHEAYCAAENEENSKSADKITYKGLSGLGIPSERNSGIGYEVEEEIVDDEYACRNDEHP